MLYIDYKTFFQEKKEDDNSIINMVLEFTVIISKKFLILKDLLNVKTVVLERLNELLTTFKFNWGYSKYFYSENDKELKDFNNSFSCFMSEGEETKLSEALLSHFTLITVNK